MTPTPTPARRWRWALQAIAVAVVVYLAWRTLAHHWTDFRGLQLTIRPNAGLLGLAILTVLVTYLIQIESWRRLIIGWGNRLSYVSAIRIWCLTNLGRYVPGKIWSVAGLVILADRAGVDRAAAAGSALGVQAIALGTGVVLAVAAAPGAAPPLRLIAAIGAAALTMGVLLWAPAMRALGRLVGGGPLSPLPVGAATGAAALMLLSWVTYGLAFWFLARGLLGGVALSPAVAAGLFALGYILGMLAVFAPSGVGVREVALVSLLTPVLGSDAAVTLSIGSRVLLTLTELGAALTSLLIPATSPRDIA